MSAPLYGTCAWECSGRISASVKAESSKGSHCVVQLPHCSQCREESQLIPIAEKSVKLMTSCDGS